MTFSHGLVPAQFILKGFLGHSKVLGGGYRAVWLGGRSCMVFYKSRMGSLGVSASVLLVVINFFKAGQT